MDSFLYPIFFCNFAGDLFFNDKDIEFNSKKETQYEVRI